MKKLKTTLLFIGLSGFIFSSLVILESMQLSQPRIPTSTTMPKYTGVKRGPSKQPETLYGLPVRLRVPKINVDAAIEHTGVTSGGDVQGPSKLPNAGWYRLGSRPGNPGSAVIAGHYSLTTNERPVFNDLHTLSRGDIVQVVDDKGTTATFIVRELKTYSKDAVAPEVFSSNDTKAHLSLVTCKGTWQKAQRTYSERLVVFADSK